MFWRPNMKLDCPFRVESDEDKIEREVERRVAEQRLEDRRAQREKEAQDNLARYVKEFDEAKADLENYVVPVSLSDGFLVLDRGTTLRVSSVESVSVDYAGGGPAISRGPHIVSLSFGKHTITGTAVRGQSSISIGLVSGESFSFQCWPFEEEAAIAQVRALVQKGSK